MTAISQAGMVTDMESRIKSGGIKPYQKSGVFDARKGVIGERIVTTIDGEDETTNAVQAGDVVIKGPKGECYIVSEKKFNERYNVDKELKAVFQKYTAVGMIRGFPYVGPTIKFIASWNEEMLCNSGDYLATPVANPDDTSVKEVYRIERSVFDETYTLIEETS